MNIKSNVLTAFLVVVALLLGASLLLGAGGTPNRGYDIIPTTDDTYTLGNASYTWDAFVNDLTLYDDVTLENGEILYNTPDAVVGIIYNDDAVELGDFQIKSSNTAVEANNYVRQSFYARDVSASHTETEVARIDLVLDAVTTSAMTSHFAFSPLTAGTMSAELGLSNAALYPIVNTGLTLGATSYRWGNARLGGTLNVDGATSCGSSLVVGTTFQAVGASTQAGIANTGALLNTGPIHATGNLSFEGALADGSTTMTATVAELNYNAGVTPGTVTASKTVMVGADSKVDAWKT
ncbi:MAG: hypothetical protein ABIH23_08525, partial [bacterium]